MTDATKYAVGLDVLRSGYVLALGRLDNGSWERLPTFTFAPLFEALNWAAVLDERVGQDWKQADGRPLRFAWRDRVPNGELMRGVRFARNSVHHQWAAAVRLSHAQRHLVAQSGPEEPPYAWIWRPTGELPTRDRTASKRAREQDEIGQRAYLAHLADRPVRQTLAALEEVFATAAETAKLAI